MAAPNSRFYRSNSARDSKHHHKNHSPPPPPSFPDDFSEKQMECAGSWDAIEWTKVEPVSIPHGMSDLLLEAEEVLVPGYGVVLVNTDEAGTLLVTNFRLLFVSEGTRKIIALGTIPLATIEKFSKLVMKPPSTSHPSDKSRSRRLLQIVGKDMRIVVFGFRSKTKQRHNVFDALWRCTRPAGLRDLYTFTWGPSKYHNSNPKVRLLNEYVRLLGISGSRRSFEDEPVTLSNEWWRISGINSNYTMCPTYPSSLIVPKYISDEEVQQACTFRAKCRLPVLSWCHSGNGAVIARSSQPSVGIMNSRSTADEKLVAALCTGATLARGSRRKLYIADARPRKNALANGAMGGGSESSSNYFQSEIVFFGIDNIHAMRDSLGKLRDYVDTYGSNPSDGMSSFLRNGGWTWGGGNLSSMSASVSTLGDTGWLIHIQNVLAGSAWIAARVGIEASSVLVHCSDGWDRTAQLVSLASLLLDPYYRTFAGFQALVEKDWLAFGHPFSDRMGTPAVLGDEAVPLELSRQASTANVPASPMRNSSGSSFTLQSNSLSHGQTSSPIFLQWVDCIAQLLRIYPFAFEFSTGFLVDFLDCVLSCRFGNFLCNSEKERQQSGVPDACGCLWAYLADLRVSGGSSHAHYNFFYDPLKHEDPLLPPAASLAPTLWPEFHLRWACPSEAQFGEIESQCWTMSRKLTEMQKAKEVAEKKAKDVSTSMEALVMEMRKEKQLSSSAMDLAKNACRESSAIKRAIQSLGCKVQFSSSGECTLDIGGTPPEIQQKFVNFTKDGSVQWEEKSDVSVSISITAGNAVPNNPLSRACQTLCPLSSREGGCKWPDAGCVQLESQFVGLKANFDAFDQLSIYDRYFDHS
ncbi:Phosphatidylinositol-3-phosphatase myotubularin-1 [Thalictrum thalictroides]|uniref:phosphatidylinositol-3,5-bisphosphate 3-phosphatase n=1 Tax=Thalictrum thalictroides TaxID=46969 RepID=A0A7J6VXR4_THATH|nr:Phosphatidylinositol-3-phosphatase myotubularin-1 [Thalictrum thalictroides]